MQIALGKLGSRQGPVVDRPSEAEESVESVRVLKIRVFLIIENRLLLDALAHLLRRQGDVEVSGKGGRSETTPEEVGKSGCDVALLDFLDPEWISVVRRQSQEKERAIKTILIGMDAERAPLLEAVRCGVTGFLLKDASAADVMAAVRAVARGEASCPPQMCATLFQTVAQMVQNRQVKKATDKMGLTLRQQKLMKLVAKGMTNKEIAEELHLSEYTVKNHMSRILKQLDAESRSEAVETVRECEHEMNCEMANSLRQEPEPPSLLEHAPQLRYRKPHNRKRKKNEIRRIVLWWPRDNGFQTNQ
jgi:two-component system response regulator DevR